MDRNNQSSPAVGLPIAGILVGLCAASIGALYTVFARFGIAQGMTPWDLTFLRFSVAGVLTLPILAYALWKDWPAMRAQWKQWLAIALLAGPLFGLLMFGALYFAPPSHAAVFPFTAMSVMGMIMAAVFLGDRITLRKAGGIAIVITGLVVLAGLSAASFKGLAFVGDALFIAAGTMWAGFGVILRRYRLDPIRATAVISFFALMSYVPIYLWTTGIGQLSAIRPSLFWIEVLVQGVIAGGGTLFTYAKMVSLLGPARAALFPALAPALAALMAWPVLDHIPGPAEIIGLGLAITGLVICVTTFNPLNPLKQGPLQLTKVSS
jgi:drug/metabolite transporter (DMT)-like permease